MRNRISIYAASLLMSVSCAASAWTNTEFYYTPQTPDLSTLIVNNKNYISAQPVLGLNLLANSFLDVGAGSTFAWLSPNDWSGVTWTGLDPVDRSSSSQRAAKTVTDPAPGYGATIFQRSGVAVGMHLNTFGPTAFPAGAQLHSLQYRVDLNRVVWSKPDLLCVSGSINLASSYSGGAVNQAMFTLYFENQVDTNQAFHINVMMFDSRASETGGDDIQTDTDVNSANKPIVFTRLQTQNQEQSAFSSPVPGYGNYLEPYRSGSVLPGDKDRGFCISPAQFNNMLTNLNNKYSGAYSTVASNYVLRYALVGPEMYTGSGRGHIGMSVNSFYVYRRL